MNEGHNWTKEDDIVAFYLYKYGDTDLLFSINEFCANRGIQISAMRMRMSNFKFLEGKGGLSNPSEQTRKVYQECKDMPKQEFLKLVCEILSV